MELGKIERLVGHFSGQEPGPTLIVMGGMHGNEPAGIFASRKILSLLQETQPFFRGDFYALAGNLGALEVGERFIDQDFNRCWTEDVVQALVEGKRVPTDSHEAHERYELFCMIEQIARQARGPIYFLDLHSTSSQSLPFGFILDFEPYGEDAHFCPPIENGQAAVALEVGRKMVDLIPVPTVTGLSAIHGTLLHYMTSRGFLSYVIEGGQHRANSTILNHEAGIFLSLFDCGCLTDEVSEKVDFYYNMLQRQTQRLPREFEIFYRHAVRDNSHFKMLPGYANFQEIDSGEEIANDHGDVICAPEACRIFLPLYQNQGDDGFFLVREAA